MTKAMCKELMAKTKKMLDDGVDSVEVYAAKLGTELYHGTDPNEYNSCIEDYIGYTDPFEWDDTLMTVDEVMKQIREYSDFIGTVMNGEDYELWLGDTSERFTDTHAQGATVGVIILYK